MREYYTLMDILVTLKKQNIKIDDELGPLNVFLKFKNGVNSFNYGFDYLLGNRYGGSSIRCFKKFTSGFDNIISTIKNQNESLIVVDENGNYKLENNNIASVNPVYQKHFNDVIENTLNNDFIKQYFLEESFEYKDYNYHIFIAPNGIYISKTKDEKQELEMVFDAKNGLVNLKNKNIVKHPLSIFKIRIPKNIFSDEMIRITDKTISGLSEEDLLSQIPSDLGDNDISSSLVLDCRSHNCLIKRI